MGESLAGGALGFSSSLGEGHLDGDGRPVPSSSAGLDEFVALAGALRHHPGTTLEFIPSVGPIPDERVQLMADMSLAADRPLNWNLLASLASEEIYEQQLEASDRAEAVGAHVIALTLPDMMRMRASTLLPGLPGWRDVTELDAGGRRAAIADPETASSACGPVPRRRPVGRWGCSRTSPSWRSPIPTHRGSGGRWERSPRRGAPTWSTCSSTWSSPTGSPSLPYFPP